MSRTPETLRRIFRRVYAPTFFLAFIAIALHTVASGKSRLWLGAVLLMAIAVSFTAEQLAPYELVWNRPRGDVLRDLAHALVNETLTLCSVALVPLLTALVPWPTLWPLHWPLVLQLALAVFIADAGITLVHFASHRFGPLWRLHAVHHSVTRLVGFNGLMKHPLHQTMETVAGAAPLVLLGLPVDVGALLGFAVAIQLLLQHSNVAMRVGILASVWAVAPVHRHHHLASATEGDVNFGLFTTLWDRLLGTTAPKKPTPRDGELGIAGRPNYPVGYGEQLIEPFRAWPNERPLGGDHAS